MSVLISRLRRPSNQKTVINLAALALLCIAAYSQSTQFFTWNNWQNIGQQIAFIVIIAMPFTMLMISGAFDLSVGSTMALSGVVAALLSETMPIGQALVLGTLVGLLVGAINAALVVGLGINSFIATIGTLYAARGAALLLSDGAEVSGVPASFDDFGNVYVFGDISILLPVSLGLVLLFTVIQGATTLGRYTVASGSNEEASYLSGVPVRRTRTTCFLLTGLAAGFAGVLQASQFGLGSPTSSTGLEFQVIVAVVVGGTSLFGGEGRVIGSFLGAVIVGVVFNGLNLATVPSYWQTVSLGVILIAAVGVDRLVRNSRDRRNSRRLKRSRAPALGDGAAPSARSPGPVAETLARPTHESAKR